jgi:hypothetical protein
MKDEFENGTALMENLTKIYLENSNKKLTKGKLLEIFSHDKFWSFDICF